MSTVVDLSAIGISAETAASAPKQVVSSGTWDTQSGIFTIKEAAVFSTPSKAVMFKLVLENEAGELFTEYANTKYASKKDEKEKGIAKGDMVDNMSGVKLISGTVAATGCTDILAKDGVFKAYAKEDQAGTILNGLLNKKATFCIRKIETEGAEYPESNQIELVLNINGENEDGDEMLEAWKAKVEKAPILKRKDKNAAKNNASAKPSEEAKQAAATVKY